MPIQNATFLCACARHGLDVHDGSKNECCDDAVVLPALSTKDLESLTPEGQKHFREDMLKLARLVESNAVMLPTELQAWYDSDGFPLVEADVSKEAVNTPADVEEAESTEEPQSEFNPDAYYMAGFEAGFSMGFGKGFDTGMKLSAKK